MAIITKEFDSPYCKLLSTRRCSRPVFTAKPRTHFLYLMDVLSDDDILFDQGSDKPRSSDRSTISTSTQTSSAPRSSTELTSSAPRSSTELTSSAARSSTEYESNNADHERTARVLSDKDLSQKSLSPGGGMIDSWSSAPYNRSKIKNSEQSVDGKEIYVIDKYSNNRKYRAGYKSQRQRPRWDKELVDKVSQKLSKCSSRAVFQTRSLRHKRPHNLKDYEQRSFKNLRSSRSNRMQVSLERSKPE